MRIEIRTIADLVRVSRLFPIGYIKQRGHITYWVFSFLSLCNSADNTTGFSEYTKTNYSKLLTSLNKQGVRK